MEINVVTTTPICIALAVNDCDGLQHVWKLALTLSYLAFKLLIVPLERFLHNWKEGGHDVAPETRNYLTKCKIYYKLFNMEATSTLENEKLGSRTRIERRDLTKKNFFKIRACRIYLLFF